MAKSKDEQTGTQRTFKKEKQRLNSDRQKELQKSSKGILNISKIYSFFYHLKMMLFEN